MRVFQAAAVLSRRRQMSGASEFGNLETWDQTDGYFFSGTSNAECHALKVTLGQAATLATIQGTTYGTDDSFEEFAAAIYSHDAGNDRPLTNLATTGRQNGSSGYSSFNVADTTALSSQEFVWIVVAAESGTPRHYYTSTTGVRVLSIDGISNADVVSFVGTPGTAWSSITNYASATVYTDRMPQIKFTI